METSLIVQLIQLGSAGAVIIVVMLFLKSNKEWGDSRDTERTAFMSYLEAERKSRTDERREDRKLLNEFSETMRVVAAKCPGPAAEPEHGNNHKRPVEGSVGGR